MDEKKRLKDSPDAQSSALAPVFVFGSPRSGTSLLSQILNAHPMIGIPLESLLYDTFWPIRHHYGDLSQADNAERLLRHMLKWRPMNAWVPQVQFVDASERLKPDHNDFHGVFQCILKTWADTQGKPIWGEKSPWHAFFWKQILDGFPSARVVHIIRDPRDASLSWKKARQGPRNVYTLARRWSGYQDVMKQVRAGWPSEQFFELRYERLVEDPQSTCQALCEFLGQSYDASMLDFHQSAQRYNTDETNRDNLAKPVMKDNTAKWRTELTANELRWIEAVARDWMDRYGYERELSEPRLAATELLRIRLISNPVSRITGMLQDTQGQREALQKLSFPLRARLRLP